MKSAYLCLATIVTVALLLLWIDNAHAHGIPLAFLPVLGSIIFFPVAVVSALLGWLAKGLYYSDRTSQKGLAIVGWTDALKEAGLMYGCFIVVAFCLDLGATFVGGYYRWWASWGLPVVLTVTPVLSTLATSFLHRRFLRAVEEDRGRDSFRIPRAWLVVLLGLISPTLFSMIMYGLAGRAPN